MRYPHELYQPVHLTSVEVLSATSPKNCGEEVYLACKISLIHVFSYFLHLCVVFTESLSKHNPTPNLLKWGTKKKRYCNKKQTHETTTKECYSLIPKMLQNENPK